MSSKRLIIPSLALAGLCLGGCQNPALSSSSLSSSTSSGNVASSSSSLQGTSLLGEQKAVSLAADEKKEYPLNISLGDQNYLCLTLTNDVPLYGVFAYQDSLAGSVEEPFFIEASSTSHDFHQFLDAFRSVGQGLGSKTLVKVSFKNVGGVQGTFKISSFMATPRVVPEEEKELYLEKDGLKIGADLACGGALTYLERKSYDGLAISEYIDNSNNIAVGVDVHEGQGDCKTILSSEVNLINICDVGREFQQSYYASVGAEEAVDGTPSDSKIPAGTLGKEKNGYQRGYCYTSGTGKWWPYNPVQGGDYKADPSQIIDYEVTAGEIYIKTRALDWAKNNVLTCSYIEAWYSIVNGMLLVKNRFIDWNGFSDIDSITSHTFEVPASYIIHPLNRFTLYAGDTPWQGKPVTTHDNLSFWGTTAQVDNIHPEDWFAWLNASDFGVGVYIPNAGSYVSGRVVSSRAITSSQNKNALSSVMATKYLYNKPYPSSPYCGAYVSNSDYTAPVANVKMKEYKPFTYSYLMAVDYLPLFRSAFKDVSTSSPLDNSNLKNWN